MNQSNMNFEFSEKITGTSSNNAHVNNAQSNRNFKESKQNQIRNFDSEILI